MDKTKKIRLSIVSLTLLMLSIGFLASAQTEPAPGAHDVPTKLEEIPGASSPKSATANDICLGKVPAEARPSCCTPPSKLFKADCEEAIIKYAEKVATPKQFTSSNPKAVEAYNLITSCLQSGAAQSTCVERVKTALAGAATNVASCLDGCVTNKPGSTNCDTCKNYYGSGGYTERTYSACDSFCVEKTPGCVSGCYSGGQISDEVNSAGEAAISNWNDQQNARTQAKTQLKALQQDVTKQEGAERSAAEEAAKKAEEKKVSPTTTSTETTPSRPSAAPRFKLIEYIYQPFISVRNFFTKIFRLGR